MSDLTISPCPPQTSHDSETRSNKSSEHVGKEEELEPLHQSHDSTLSPSKYHKLAIFLLSLYIPLVVLPWTLTCVMAKRPLSASSYYNQKGLLDTDIDRIEKWVVAVNVLNSIGSLITIPVLSTLIAQAAVVYSHQHYKDSRYRLEYLVAFADRGWTDGFTVAKSCKWPGGITNGSRNLLFFAAVTIIIGSIQQPLYQILVPMENILVPTCHDTSYGERLLRSRALPQCSRNGLPAKEIGWDMEPTQMALVTQYEIFSRFLGELSVASLIDVKPNLWNNASDPSSNKLMLRDHGSGAFVAALEQGTSTGVLRQHIMRLNSSVECQRIPRAAFPTDCPGETPFTRTFSHGNNMTRICAPGSRRLSPFTMSRNRQDIREELYIDILEQCEIGYPQIIDYRNLSSDYTLLCTASTTRGYFELGNYRNNNTWGPLLDKWPSQKDLAMNFNDYLSFSDPRNRSSSGPRYPSEYANSPLINKNSDYVPGPLMMATIALFGNNTFFDIAVQAWNSSLDTNSNVLSGERLCNLVPFARLEPVNFDPSKPWSDSLFPGCDLATQTQRENLNARKFLSKWLHGFNNTGTAVTALSTAVFLANQAVVTRDQLLSRYSSTSNSRDNYGRTIYSGYGTTIRKPRLSVPVIVGMSCILVLELWCLAVLAWLIYRGPSETRSLDAMAFLRLKELMEEEKSQWVADT